MYVSRRDGRAYRLSSAEVAQRFGSLIVHQARMDSVFSAAIGDHGFVLRHPDLAVLKDAAQAIQELA
jgi:hypothetical protein